MTLPETMNSMMLLSPGQKLVRKILPLPIPSVDQLLVKVIACGVCRTDLHVIDGELPSPKLPLIPGHEIIGLVVKTGRDVRNFKINDLVGIPWLGYTCGKCQYCLKGRENLCENAKFTGYTLDGGYAEYTVAQEQYCLPLSPQFNDFSKAPLLCAGLIGYRSYSMINEDAENVGFYGFGAAAHILIQIAVKQGKRIFAFTTPGDTEAQSLAEKLGAEWAGDSVQKPPVRLDAAIIFAPVGNLIPKALSDTDKGATVVCAGIHMTDIPSFPYSILWEERVLRSVANLTRKDAEAFLKITAEIPIKTETQFFNLLEANEALESLRLGKITGAAVLIVDRNLILT